MPWLASIQVVPFGDVSRRKSFVEALPPSPQVLDASIAISVTSTVTGSLIVIDFGVANGLLSLPSLASLPHPAIPECEWESGSSRTTPD
jgi:hypothetical protein